ncbi:hypothetical protein [Agrobacterium tomkonis]|uniref:hypothetical protein n=1 Tax=Agrobacterium tomkonis TaxID=1183410 RepID=UPI001CD83E52
MIMQPFLPVTAGAAATNVEVTGKMVALEINSFKSVFPANLKDGSSIDFPLDSSDRVQGKPASVLRARWPTFQSNKTFFTSIY